MPEIELASVHGVGVPDDEPAVVDDRAGASDRTGGAVRAQDQEAARVDRRGSGVGVGARQESLTGDGERQRSRDDAGEDGQVQGQRGGCAAVDDLAASFQIGDLGRHAAKIDRGRGADGGGPAGEQASEKLASPARSVPSSHVDGRRRAGAAGRRAPDDHAVVARRADVSVTLELKVQPTVLFSVRVVPCAAAIVTAPIPPGPVKSSLVGELHARRREKLPGNESQPRPFPATRSCRRELAAEQEAECDRVRAVELDVAVVDLERVERELARRAFDQLGAGRIDVVARRRSRPA